MTRMTHRALRTPEAQLALPIDVEIVPPPAMRTGKVVSTNAPGAGCWSAPTPASSSERARGAAAHGGGGRTALRLTARTGQDRSTTAARRERPRTRKAADDDRDRGLHLRRVRRALRRQVPQRHRPRLRLHLRRAPPRHRLTSDNAPNRMDRPRRRATRRFAQLHGHDPDELRLEFGQQELFPTTNPAAGQDTNAPTHQPDGAAPAPPTEPLPQHHQRRPSPAAPPPPRQSPARPAPPTPTAPSSRTDLAIGR